MSDPSLLGPVEETTPLLAKRSSGNRPTPLPKTQLFICLFLRVTEPIAYQVCFPFINQFLLDIGAVTDPRKTGFYAGIIESVFAFTELLTVFQWGKISDKIGRKPVLLIGCVTSAISAICFGLSTTLPALIISRAINGLANGNVAVLKSVIGELTDETNQAKAFSYFPLSLAIGVILASSIGGYLSNITQTFPALAHVFPVLESHPYFLPCFVGACFPIVSGITAFFIMKETLPPKSADDDDGEESLSAFQLLTGDIRPLMWSFFLMSLESIAYTALLPLFFFTPVTDGGLGFTEAQIGTALSIRGVATVLVQLFAFPTLNRTVGNTKLCRILISLFIPTFLALPLLNIFARNGQTALVWTGVAAILLLGAASNMSFACNLIMTNDAVPNRRSLGSLNGLAAFFSSCTRVVGPGAANALFALSVDQHMLGGQLIWIFMTALALISWHASFALKETYAKSS